MKAADVLADNALTLAYSYIGPVLTHPMYLNGTIGQAKAHLAATAKKITADIDGVTAYVSVNKALVTQSSSAIPIVPLYISILYKVMKEAGLHEGCIEQMQRLLSDKVYGGAVETDDEGLIRMDDREMRPDIQDKVSALWADISDENLSESADIAGYQREFNQIFGFDVPGTDYEAETDPSVGIESIK